ncbi:MAG: DUF3822 family protein [Bacteroidales bacterium]|nr:DUF3822 family protein [Bacteroidales bacterium]
MSTRISFRYKSDNKAEDLTPYAKAIRFQEDGFCIALYRPEEKDLYLLEEHLFEEDYPLNGKMHQLAEVAGQWATGGPLRFTCFNACNTQIPKQLFEEENKMLYLQLLTEQPYRFLPMEETVEPYGACLLSGWDKNLYHEALALYPDCRMQSGMGILLHLLAQQEGKKKIAAFVENSCLNIAAEENGKLLGANRFSFQNSNDFLYYLAGFARTLFGDLRDVKLYFGGNVEIQSQLYASTQKYFPDLHLMACGYPQLPQEQHRFCDLLYGGL